MFPEYYPDNRNIGPFKYRFRSLIFQINYSIDDIDYRLSHGLSLKMNWLFLYLFRGLVLAHPDLLSLCSKLFQSFREYHVVFPQFFRKRAVVGGGLGGGGCGGVISKGGVGELRRESPNFKRDSFLPSACLQR
jgi:hypothetical protein